MELVSWPICYIKDVVLLGQQLSTWVLVDNLPNLQNINVFLSLSLALAVYVYLCGCP